MILRAKGQKQYGCDAEGCKEMTGMMPISSPVPSGWVRIELKSYTGVWETKLLFCAECGAKALELCGVVKSD